MSINSLSRISQLLAVQTTVWCISDRGLQQRLHTPMRYSAVCLYTVGLHDNPHHRVIV